MKKISKEELEEISDIGVKINVVIFTLLIIAFIIMSYVYVYTSTDIKFSVKSIPIIVFGICMILILIGNIFYFGKKENIFSNCAFVLLGINLIVTGIVWDVFYFKEEPIVMMVGHLFILGGIGTFYSLIKNR